MECCAEPSDSSCVDWVQSARLGGSERARDAPLEAAPTRGIKSPPAPLMLPGSRARARPARAACASRACAQEVGAYAPCAGPAMHERTVGSNIALESMGAGAASTRPPPSDPRRVEAARVPASCAGCASSSARSGARSDNGCAAGPHPAGSHPVAPHAVAPHPWDLTSWDLSPWDPTPRTCTCHVNSCPCPCTCSCTWACT